MKWVVLILICAVMLFPLVLMVTNSFSDAKQFLVYPPRVLPLSWTAENYRSVFTLPLIGRWILNTLTLAGIAVVAGVLVNGAAGYAFAFSRARWAKVAFWCMMAPIFVTRMTLLVAQFVVVSKLHLRGLPAVVSMSVFWPTGIFLFRNYFREVPIGIVESARLDGAGEWTVLTKVVLPLLRPIVGAAVVFLGMGAMGDYIWQMLNLQQAEQQTYLVGLVAAATFQYQIKNVGFELAIGTLLFIPYLVLFSISSRYFISGLTGGALKE